MPDVGADARNVAAPVALQNENAVIRRADLERLQSLLRVANAQRRFAIFDLDEIVLSVRQSVANREEPLGVRLPIAGELLIDFRIDALIHRKNLGIIEFESLR